MRQLSPNPEVCELWPIFGLLPVCYAIGSAKNDFHILVTEEKFTRIPYDVEMIKKIIFLRLKIRFYQNLATLGCDHLHGKNSSQKW